MTGSLADSAILLQAASFAADRHRHQRRKDAAASPYVNHPLAVACILSNVGGVRDEALLVAALLHDTVEDTNTTLDELAAEFGPVVSGIVGEVTDDKSLPRSRRKALQVEHAAHASDAAKQLKIADKIANVRDIASRPPEGWSLDRKLEYVAWADQVVAGCRGVNAALDAAYDEASEAARRALRAER